MTSRDLVATCWTSAGAVGPLDPSEESPLNAVDRIAAVADGGWLGLGFAQADLAVIRDTIGFDGLAAAADRYGVRHVEVELVTE